MHLISVFLLAALPMTLGLPLEVRGSLTPSLALPDPALPTASLTSNQIQALVCVCQGFLLSGLLTGIPETDPVHALCAAYPASLCSSSTSSSSGGTSIPLQGSATSALGNVGDVGTIASRLFNNLPIGAIAKEKRNSEIEGRQTTSSTTVGGFSLPNIPDIGLGDVGTVAAASSGVGTSIPRLVGTASAVTGLLGAGSLSIVAREAKQEKEKRQLDGLTALLAPVAGGLLPTTNPITTTVTELLGSFGDGLSGVGGSNPLSNIIGRSSILSGILVDARDAEEKENRQLGGFADPVTIVTGLVGSIAGGLTGGSGSDPLMGPTGGSKPPSGVAGGLTGGTGSLTGGLPIVGDNGLGGSSSIAR
ncbi:hypothetical protein BDZ45DRAFT_775365 [Acephala macrosclerotiorum]|nr:hypothetical protein BDZ45DRAFT_775365 [Acephala macrosclerotiorum]